MRQLPNVLTLVRVLASPFLAWLIVRSRFLEALGLVLLAGLTDWFDGFAARRLKAEGRLGTILDPLADKAMLVTLFVALTAVRLIPNWLLLVVLGRDFVIVIGAFLLRRFRNSRNFLPSTLGKISTFFQILLVLLVLLHAWTPNRVFWAWQMAALALSTFFTAASGLDYVRQGIQIAGSDRPSKKVE